MKKTFLFILSIFTLSFLSIACEDKEKQQQAEQERYTKHQDSVFKYLEANWKIDIPETSQELTDILSKWNAWKEFKQEAELKPVTSIDAYQKKIAQIDNRLQSITFVKYPVEIDEKDNKARLTVLYNSVKNLNMFLNLDPIEIGKVDMYLKETNKNITLLIKNMERNLQAKKIPLELGEEEMLELINEERRANPDEQTEE
ncbi:MULTISPECIES: hypothetical protein [Myroides]|uniref:Lipoprotein n=1 Tax=Myroides albus TaxID=2562892 RepID=A0A6I3LKT6_9FLAO|nr:MULTISPECIES: hypothetical protein [Myroides]MTG96635.1 hypothetical protein [Myroides albus]MVX35266.1 hypothetical protein [Myroides sp. LoEW2-1]UVD80952.1 hypothetical protein NWE55_06825 [Myroides albus]